MENISRNKHLYVRPEIVVIPLQIEAAMVGLVASVNPDNDFGGDAGDARIGRNPNTGDLTPFPDGDGGSTSPWAEEGEIDF